MWRVQYVDDQPRAEPHLPDARARPDHDLRPRLTACNLQHVARRFSRRAYGAAPIEPKQQAIAMAREVGSVTARQIENDTAEPRMVARANRYLRRLRHSRHDR